MFLSDYFKNNTSSNFMPIAEASQRSKHVFSHDNFGRQSQDCAHSLYLQFKACTRFYSRFHICFIGFLALQVLGFLLFFSALSKSPILAFGLALFFLTLFTYFVLLFFFDTRKPQQLMEIRQQFLQSCQSYLPFDRGSHSYHIPLAHAFNYFVSYISSEERAYYIPTSTIPSLSPLLEKLYIRLHWKNFLLIKEMLLSLSIDELITFIKSHPTDTQAHAALASTYHMLSRLYLNPKKLDPSNSLAWVSQEYESPVMQDKFLRYSERALEEFKIISEYAPEDPWVHLQLAHIYHDRGVSEQEIKEYEILHRLQPDDVNILYELGVLYFQQGYSSKGLKVYEQIRNAQHKEAESLIEHYDAYLLQEPVYSASSAK